MEHKLEKNIFKLMIPIFIELAFFILMGTVDTVMISIYENSRGLFGSVAAVGNATTVLNLFGVLINIISMGVGVTVSQYLGAKKRKEANDTIGTGVIVQIFVGITIMTVLMLTGNLLFSIIDTPVDIKPLANDYLFYGSIGIAFVSITGSINAGLRSNGKGKQIVTGAIIANIGNILFNLIFIYGFWFIPELGVAGAAIATTLMRFMMMIISSFFLFRYVGHNVFKSRVIKEHLDKILKIGIPSALENMSYNILQFTVLAFINKFGEKTITARTYANTILSYVFLFSSSFASANAIIVGYFVGEKDYANAIKTTRKVTLTASIIGFSVTLLINIFRGPLVGLLTQDPMIAEEVYKVLFLAIFLEIGRVFNMVHLQALRSANDTRIPLLVAVLSMFGVGIVFAYIFSIKLSMGLFGVYLGLLLDEFLRGILNMIRFNRKSWLRPLEALQI